MKNPNSSFLLILSILVIISSLFAEAQPIDTQLIRCASTERDSVRFSRNSKLLNLRQKSEAAIQNYIKTNHAQLRTSAEEIVTIPVVVHVVHNQSDNQIGGANNANITDEQIRSQIDILNEDYSNQSGYEGFYTDSLGVDTGIRFRLVGVVRKYNAKTQFSPLTDDDLLSSISPPWYTNRYLNIWVCRLSNRYLGAAQFPTVTEITDLTDGLETRDENENYQLTDGVIIDFRYFGRNSPAVSSDLYNLGRTTTHEVGHWLGLIHIWGDSYCGTDYCADTPKAEEANQTTDISCVPKFSNCDGTVSRNMIENYMDYSPDQCMSVFTNDQKERMHAVLALSPRRARMVEYSQRTDTSVTLNLYPNPVSDYLNADIYTPDYKPFSVTIFNIRGIKIADEVPNWTQIDVKNYPAGLYFLKVSTDNQSVIKRFVIP